MKKVIKLDRIPEKSIILNGFGKIDYRDTYKIQITTHDFTIDKITTDIFTMPSKFDHLMKLRNRIVKIFGLKTGDMEDPANEPLYVRGSKLAYFTVSDRNESEIVMAEDDKHLNFRTSVLVEKGTDASSVYLSTIVQFNNFFGWLYFLPVKPFHRIMIQSILRKYANGNEHVNRVC